MSPDGKDSPEDQTRENGLRLLTEIVRNHGNLHAIDLARARRSTDDKDAEGFDQAILFALIKSQASQALRLHIALKFDRIDIVHDMMDVTSESLQPGELYAWTISLVTEEWLCRHLWRQPRPELPLAGLSCSQTWHKALVLSLSKDKTPT